MKTSRLMLTLAGLGLILAGAAGAADKAAATTAPIKELESSDRAALRAYHEKALSIYDKNGDGKLDPTERAALRADVEAGRMDPLPARSGGRGRGARRGPPPGILEQYDADGDGRLSREERAAIRADIESGKLEAPKGRAGRGPHGPPPPESSDVTEG